MKGLRLVFSYWNRAADENEEKYQGVLGNRPVAIAE
jgi:hypothetical protein